ncbi:MAG: hypothetical protein JWM56_515 [Candidatus Peribacteria bacterium]|nr:hypothetical protein [Candidatus Peribacteria bacterium]
MRKRLMGDMVIVVGLFIGSMYLLSQASAYAVLPSRTRRTKKEADNHKNRLPGNTAALPDDHRASQVLMPGSPFSWN